MVFTEDTFEQAVIELFEGMGYTHVYAPDMSRSDYSSPLLDSVLQDSLVRINKGLPLDAIQEATDEDIRKIADTYQAYCNGSQEDIKGFCAVVSMENIAAQDYILTPGRYVGIEEQEDDGEPFDEKMARLTSELSALFGKSHALEAEIREKLGAIGYEI